MASIREINVGGTIHDVKSTHYATCSTATGTAAKTATVQNGTFTLETGVKVSVKFTYANSVASATLNVNSTGAKAIQFAGAALASTQYWAANQVVDFVYDGTYWAISGVVKDNNTDNDTNVTQAAAITTNGNYPLLLGYSTATTAVTNTVNKTTTLNYNPSTKALTTGNIVLSNGYGTTLPSSGVEGQVFFLVID